MEYLLNLSEDEEVACAVCSHAEILAKEAQKKEFAKQHVSQTFLVLICHYCISLESNYRKTSCQQGSADASNSLLDSSKCVLQ